MDIIPYKILIVDDEEVIRISSKMALEKDGYIIDLAENGEKGLELFKSSIPDIVLLDLMMPGISGMELLKMLADHDPNVVKIVITGYASIPIAVEAMRLGAHDFIPKPFTPDILRALVKKGIEKRRFFLENTALKEEKERIRKNMMSLVSHELRAPLAVTVQYLEIILAGMAGKISFQSEDMIKRCVVRLREMLSLIGKWLNLSTFDPVKISQIFERIDIKTVVEEALEIYKEKARDKKVDINLEIPETPLFIKGFRPLLMEIFNNLISNAIKYNINNGSLNVILGKKENMIRVEISDTGIGIDKKHIPKIFDEFYRADGRRTAEVSGSGLGLAIVKKLLDVHNGEIRIRSSLGHGTCAYVFFPEYEQSYNEV